jgi:diguanylate cyclase (GGDEF)-like protein/PAS domain S-box-containing protein
VSIPDTASSNASETLRKHAYLTAIMANMAQGLSVFDENLCLQVWNQGFLDVLGLPADTVKEGAHFSDLIRIPALRGEFGPGDIEEHVNRITTLAKKFEAHRLERTRPNGRTHLTQGQPLFINGKLAGFITTYTDITANKEAEQALRQQHDMLQAVIQNVPCGISLFDKDQKLALHNQEFLKLLDFPADLVANQSATLESIFRFNAARGEYGTGDIEAQVKARLELARSPSPHHFERDRPNGQVLDIHGAPMPDGGFVTFYTSATERRRTIGQQHLAQKVFNHSPTGIIITDEAHRILSMNPATSQMTGYDAYELSGHTIFALISLNEDLPLDQLQNHLTIHKTWAGELTTTKKNGQDFTADIRLSQVSGPTEKEPAHFIWMLADISERKRLEEQMRHIAQHDALTGLPNRLALLMRLAQLLPEARRHQWKLAIMFIDLDRFKIINDTLGHQVGDELLREVACRLSNAIRETDYVARLGGDEFVILLPAINSAADAAVIGSKIIAKLSTAIDAEGHELHTSPSIGISIFPDDGPDADTVMRNADMAMYQAKAAGRNNYQFFTQEMNHATATRLDLEHKLRHALSRNEFSIAYQPQFSANSSKPTGVEALIRWHHPTDGMISPDRFIPIAEETELIVDIGEWVLQTACREMKHWQDKGLGMMRIAVNVSARQLQRRDFCNTVAGALAESGLPAECLELEITESSVMENPEESIQILQNIRRMGVTLAIDDFGTGYSSLAYLKRFPIDHLKIDRSFVTDIETDLNDRAIAFGTIALAHSLGLNVIAEGVETEDQLELLRSNGCDEIQGYLLSKPLTSGAAFAFLHALHPAG